MERPGEGRKRVAPSLADFVLGSPRNNNLNWAFAGDDVHSPGRLFLEDRVDARRFARSCGTRENHQPLWAGDEFPNRGTKIRRHAQRLHGWNEIYVCLQPQDRRFHVKVKGRVDTKQIFSALVFSAELAVLRLVTLGGIKPGLGFKEAKNVLPDIDQFYRLRPVSIYFEFDPERSVVGKALKH